MVNGMNYYLFDFDGTIYDGDSSIDFFLFCIKKDKKVILNVPKMIFATILYKLKIINKTKMKEKYFSFLRKVKNIDIIVEEFWDKNSYKMKPFFEKRKHNNDIIISASPYFLLEPIVKKYKVKDLLASNVDKYSGKFLENNCLGSEKVKVFLKKYPNAKIKEMYSDSLKDIPLLDIAEKGYLVVKNDIILYTEISKKELFLTKIKKRYDRNREIISYIIVGILTVLVNLIVKWTLLFTIFDAKNALELQTVVVISWLIAVFFAYFSNRIFVFKSNQKNVLKEIINFFLSRVLTLLLEMVIMWCLINVLGLNSNLWVVIWTCLVQIIVIVLNYILSKLFVFKKN